jgi:hypothetical protein
MSDPSGDAPTPEWVLLDAAAQHESDPADFPIPREAQRSALRRGDVAEVVLVLDPEPPSGPNAERLRVEVQLAHADGSYDGRVADEPVVVSSLARSAPIAFEPRHVAGIALAHGATFDRTLRAVVSASALAVSGPPRWVTHDEPVAEDDSGWTVTAGDESKEYFDGAAEERMLALTLGELADRYPSLVQIFERGGGDWVYDPDEQGYLPFEGP